MHLALSPSVLARQILPEHSPGLSWKLAEEIIVEKVKKMKGKRVHGRDEIDSYSLKVTAPLIEDSVPAVSA